MTTAGRRSLALLLAALLLVAGVPVAAGAGAAPAAATATVTGGSSGDADGGDGEPAGPWGGGESTHEPSGDASRYEPAPSEPHVTDEGTVPLLVEAPGGDAAAVEVAVDGAVEVRELYGTDLVVVEVPEESVDDALADLASDDDVDFVEYDGVATIALEPNDPLWPNQWQDGFRAARFPQAWNLSTGSAGTVIAVLDTGVNPVSELSGRVLPGRNFMANPPNGNTTDDNVADGGHGTLSASVAAGAGNNGIGFAGACWRCSVLPVKILNAGGEGPISRVAEGIRWAADNGADVINLSLTGNAQSDLRNAVQYARSRGVVLVAAAGNEGASTPRYPAAYPEVVGVAGTDQTGESLASASNFGQWVSVAAPFTNVAQGLDGFGLFHGTSSATPVVAGALGLAISRTPAVSVAELERRVGATATPLAGIEHGFIDARAIVDGPRLTLTTAPGSLFGIETVRVQAGGTPSGIVGTPTLHAGSTAIPLSAAGSGVWTGRWDTRSIPRGSVTLRATARNGVGNRTTERRTVQVLNTPPVSGFVDVPRSAFYAVPVDFLKHTGVTTGVGGSNRYEPDSFVTRGQMAVFLWRMAGQPPGSGAPFADVPPNAFYTQATRWLRQTGITTGVGGTNFFDPEGAVTRAQMVTFLHRFAGTPGASRAHAFTDVDRRSFAERSISWAAFHRITTGIGGTSLFAPEDWVTRGQMATFIQRYARTRSAHGGKAIDLAI